MKIIYGCFMLIVFCMEPSMQATPYQLCKDGYPPKELRVNNCTAYPCPAIRGRDFFAEWDFTILQDTKALKPRVKATTFDTTVAFPYQQTNACTSLKNAKCPLISGQIVTYQLHMLILRLYPKINVNVEFAFLDDNNKVVVCFQLPLKVTDR